MMKCLVMAMAVLAFAGMAWCWDMADHVKAAPNGQGDMLIYPFYVASNGGWETEVWVTNTSPNRSVIAHIAFYSARTSVELLDFFLFLTPTDVWTGTIRYNNGTVELYSTDDSAMTSSGVFASSTNPLTVTLQNPLAVGGTACVASAEPWTNQIGYLKVLEAAHSANVTAATAFVSGSTTYNLNRPPVAKAGLFAAFGAFLTQSASNPLIMDGINVLTGHLEFRNTITGQNATIPATALRDYDNQLPVGYGQSIGFAAGCGYAGGAGVTPAAPNISALGFADLDGNAITTGGCQVGGGPASVTGNTTICNPAGVDAATTAGCGCSAAGFFGCQTNSVGEVEAALAKDWLAMPVATKAATVHILTFPTKQTSTGVAGTATDCYFVSTPSPFFNEVSGIVGQPFRVIQPPAIRPTTYSASWETWGCFSYASTDYDMSETSSTVSSIFSPGAKPQTLCGEVNLRYGDFAFEDGWVVYNFSNVPAANGIGTAVYTTRFDTQANIIPGTYDAQYTGAPVIGTTLHMGADGLTLLPASYADGNVIVDASANGVFNDAADLVYYYYPYWDQANVNDVGGGMAVAGNNFVGRDEVGCVGGTLPCGITAAAPYLGGGGNIYQNKFSGNRPGLTVPTALGPLPAVGATDGERPVSANP